MSKFKTKHKKTKIITQRLKSITSYVQDQGTNNFLLWYNRNIYTQG